MGLKKLSIFVVSIFVVNISFAQQKKLDSMLHELTIHLQEDSLRADLFCSISSLYKDIDPSKGLAMADSAISISQKHKIITELCYSYVAKGANYQAIANNSLALDCFQKALVLAHTLNNRKAMINIYSNTGLVYFEIGQYPKALEYHFQSLKICEDPSSPETVRKNIVLADINIGIVYRMMQQYPKALEYYRKGLNEALKLNDSASMALLYAGLGTVSSEMKDKSTAYEYYKKALQINERLNKKKLIASNLYNIGSLLREINDYPNAMVALRRSLELWKEIGNKIRIGIVISEIGVVYEYAPDKDLKALGISAKERYPLALKYMEQGLQLAIETEDLVGIYTNYNNLTDLYKKTGDYKKALAANENFVKFYDSVQNDSKKRDVERQQIQYEFEKREMIAKADNDKKQALATAEINRQKSVRNVALTGIGLLIAASITVFIFYKKNRDADLKFQIADMEMKALRAQMNPHFIFNSLNSINDYISRNEIHAASEYLSSFAVLMRAVLENSEEKEVPLADDLKVLEYYVQLECSRMAHRFIYSVSIADDIDPETVLIPPMLLQPFVENSIWHGLSKRKEGGRLQINIDKQGNTLYCRIEDNGGGRHLSQSMMGNKKSLGMKITQSRIDMLNSIKKTNARISFTDLAEGTSVNIQLPLSHKF